MQKLEFYLTTNRCYQKAKFSSAENSASMTLNLSTSPQNSKNYGVLKKSTGMQSTIFEVSTSVLFVNKRRETAGVVLTPLRMKFSPNSEFDEDQALGRSKSESKHLHNGVY